MQGIIHAIALVATRLGIPWIAAGIALLITVGGLGQAGAWFAAAGRLPFVIGIDRRLPPSFAKIHPRWGTPYVALLVQAVIAAIFDLRGAGGNVGGRRLQCAREHVGDRVLSSVHVHVRGDDQAAARAGRAGGDSRAGGTPVAIALGAIGFTTTTISVGLAMLPADDEPNKPLAVIKIVGLTLAMIALGVGLYVAGRRK